MEAIVSKATPDLICLKLCAFAIWFTQRPLWLVKLNTTVYHGYWFEKVRVGLLLNWMGWCFFEAR